jgi:AraC family transcriptional regulator of arabinose operon
MDFALKNMDYPEMDWIPHGFYGERMNVLPGPLVDAAARHPLLRGLFPCDAGYFPEAHRHGILRKEGTRSAILIICRAGRGWVELDG